MPMLRSATLAAITLALLAGTTWAMDPGITVGVGGRSLAPPVVATSAGRSTDDGLARPGMHANDNRAGVGVARAGGNNMTTNRASDDGFTRAGTAVRVTAGIGRSTLETVPGRAPVYMSITAGRRAEETGIGGRSR
jgi:hypothetical protein